MCQTQNPFMNFRDFMSQFSTYFRWIYNFSVNNGNLFYDSKNMNKIYFHRHYLKIRIFYLLAVGNRERESIKL